MSEVNSLGYIISVFDGSAWITQDGRVTDHWSERGIWPTEESAQKAMKQFFKDEKERV